MKKILVAVDGSPQSLHAARLARDLARSTGARLTLVYSAPLVMLPGELPLKMAWDVIKADAERGNQLLAAAADALAEPGLEAIGLEGPPAERIAELAEKEDYDMVVVGSRGRNAVARVLLGSVADRMVHICRRPVLVVR